MPPGAVGYVELPAAAGFEVVWGRTGSLFVRRFGLAPVASIEPVNTQEVFGVASS
jgi:hypothetical protein